MSKTLIILNDPPYGGVCGTCVDARGIEDGGLIAGTHRSTMEELTAWTQWSDKVLVF